MGEVPAVGNYSRIMSQPGDKMGRRFEELRQLTAADAGKTVWVRARVHNVRAKVRLDWIGLDLICLCVLSSRLGALVLVSIQYQHR